MQDVSEALRSQLREAFPAVFDGDASFDPDGPLVPADQHVALAAHLKQRLGFTLYVTVVASHWPSEDDDTPEAFEVATVLRQPQRGGEAFCWRVRLEGDAPTLPTLCPLFVGVDWQEREQYDLVGVTFEGHPDLRRLMLPEDWEGHPLRKEYAIDTPHAPWR